MNHTLLIPWSGLCRFLNKAKISRQHTTNSTSEVNRRQTFRRLRYNFTKACRWQQHFWRARAICEIANYVFPVTYHKPTANKWTLRKSIFSHEGYKRFFFLYCEFDLGPGGLCSGLCFQVSDLGCDAHLQESRWSVEYLMRLFIWHHVVISSEFSIPYWKLLCVRTFPRNQFRAFLYDVNLQIAKNSLVNIYWLSIASINKSLLFKTVSMLRVFEF